MVFPSRLSCVALAFPMPICQQVFISRNYANIRKTPSPPFSPLVTDPVIEIPVPAIIDAITLSEVIVLSNSTPIPGESRPAFLHDHVPFTHSLIMSGIMHSLTRPR
jgi:hypothetical protein